MIDEPQKKSEAPRLPLGDDGPGHWAPLGRSDVLALGAAVVVLLAIAIPRLAPGICFGDSGDLQLASATLGIAHPPGYAGYVSFGFLVSHVPGVDPAYMVSLVCFGSGVVAMILCALLQIRLGLNAWVSSAIALALMGHPRVWSNLLLPEVYMPTLALLAGGSYLLTKYAVLGRQRDVLTASFLVGVALANRPPVLFILPGLLVAWWITERRLARSEDRKSVVGWVLLVAAVPCVYSPGYLWVRDQPDTSCNYIQQYNDETGELPAVEDGARAKCKRVVWHLTGRQYRDLLDDSASGIWSRLRYIRRQVVSDSGLASAIMAVLALLGGALMWRRCRATVWIVGGMAIGSVLYLCVYRVHGDAADVLPLLWVAAVLVGVSLSRLIPHGAGGYRGIIGIAVLLVAISWTLVDAPRRHDAGREEDATGYLDSVDVASLPESSVIFSTWGESTPLWYAQHVLTSRGDIRVINADSGRWVSMIEELVREGDVETGPIFLTQVIDPPSGCVLTPFRELHRLEMSENPALPR